MCQRDSILHSRETVSLGGRAEPMFELMKRADMVCMDMGRQPNDRLSGLDIEEGKQRSEAHSKINDQIGILADDMEKVRPEKPVHMRLPDAPDPIGELFCTKPVCSFSHFVSLNEGDC
jgi:hypothetical protein